LVEPDPDRGYNSHADVAKYALMHQLRGRRDGCPTFIMGVASWLKSAREHVRFDQRLRRAYIGTVALSSKRRTANGQPVETAEAIGWLREAIEPPTSAPTPAQA
jgi:hypothetical protein